MTVPLASTCSIGDMTFANFILEIGQHAAAGSAPPATSEMAVPDGLGFDLDGLFTASSGATADAILHYTVTTTDAADTIDRVRLYGVGGQSGTGTSGVDEVLCAGGLLGACPAGGNYALSVTGNGVAAQVAFAGVNEVDIPKGHLHRWRPVGIGNAVVRNQCSRSAGARAGIAGPPRGRFVRPWRSARVSKITGRPSQGSTGSARALRGQGRVAFRPASAARAGSAAPGHRGDRFLGSLSEIFTDDRCRSEKSSSSCRPHSKCRRLAAETCSFCYHFKDVNGDR